MYVELFDVELPVVGRLVAVDAEALLALLAALVVRLELLAELLVGRLYVRI